MRLACMTFSMGPGTLDENVAKIKSLGLDCVDLATGMPGARQVDKFEAANRPDATAKWVRDALDRAEMDVSEVFLLYFSDPINDPDPAKRRASRSLFVGYARFCQLIGAESIMMIPGPVHEELGEQASRRLSAEELRYYVDTAASSGLQLNIEPHYPSLCQSPEGTIQLCEAVPGLRITLDYSHFVAQGYDQGAVEPLHAYASHMHARQARLGNRNVSHREGAIDFQRIVHKLVDDGYEGVVCLEYEPHDLDYYEETRLLKDDLLRFMRDR